MKKSPLLFGISALAYAVPCVHGVNVFVDGGFETNPITFDGPPFIATFEGFSSGAAASLVEISADSPRSGSLSLDISIAGDVDSFAGVFQDISVAGLEGTPVLYSGYHQLVGDAGGSEYRIEWRNEATNTEISRTQLTAGPSDGGGYELFTLNDSVPVGADIARVVYNIQTFGPGANQNVFVDDVTFDVVPEPSGVALLGVSALGLIARRRR